MIVREDFVTNSSSTSYVFVGEKIELEDLTKEVFESKGYCVYAIGKNLYEGIDLFEIQPPMIPHLQHVESTIDLYKVYSISWDTDYIPLKELKHLGDRIYNCNVESGFADQHSTESMEEFIDRYLDEDKNE